MSNDKQFLSRWYAINFWKTVLNFKKKFVLQVHTYQNFYNAFDSREILTKWKMIFSYILFIIYNNYGFAFAELWM